MTKNEERCYMTKKKTKAPTVPAIVDRLAEIVMCPDEATAAMLLDKTIKACIGYKKRGAFDYSLDDDDGVEMSEDDIKHALTMIKGVSPQNFTEALLASQFAALHVRGMTLLADKYNHRYGMAMLRLSQATLETIQRLRGRGTQNITVKHYHIHNEGQAIIGDVNTGGGHG